MVMTKAGGITLKKTMIAKHGGYEEYKKYMRGLAAKGGKKGTTGGFFQNRELARVAGAKGGKISKRPKRVHSKTTQSRLVTQYQAERLTSKPKNLLERLLHGNR